MKFSSGTFSLAGSFGGTDRSLLEDDPTDKDPLFCKDLVLEAESLPLVDSLLDLVTLHFCREVTETSEEDPVPFLLGRISTDGKVL